MGEIVSQEKNSSIDGTVIPHAYPHKFVRAIDKASFRPNLVMRFIKAELHTFAV